ncbi:MAG: type II secretion system F family protein [Firmicutes bacterium]|nr:type II secretion system F family protein [Bacillota bacterium]
MAAAVILLGNLFGIGVAIQESQNTETKYLLRNPYGEGAYEQNLKVQRGNKEQEISIYVEEETYGEEKKKQFLQEAMEYLEQWFQEETRKTGEIHNHVEFPEEIKDNPVQLSWSTENPQVLNWEGKIGDAVDGQGEKVKVFCGISLGEQEEVWQKTVTVYPIALNEEQELAKKIQIQAEELSKDEEKKFLLPATLEGEHMHYEVEKEHTGLLICALSLVLGIGIFPLAREKEKQREELRKKEMQRDYPDIVEKLVLFLRAGFSIRKAMEKLADGYLRNRDKYRLGERAAYEEVVKTCKEMEGGVYEAEAYERMGRRFGLPQYKMLSVLLVQNLRKGNENLLELLEREAASVTEERKRNAKVQGEEAGVKLLLPMVMQLIVVLIILMVPAFLNFM